MIRINVNKQCVFANKTVYHLYNSKTESLDDLSCRKYVVSRKWVMQFLKQFFFLSGLNYIHYFIFFELFVLLCGFCLVVINSHMFNASEVQVCTRCGKPNNQAVASSGLTKFCDCDILPYVSTSP
jgi:hypothetical protein